MCKYSSEDITDVEKAVHAYGLCKVTSEPEQLGFQNYELEEILSLLCYSKIDGSWRLFDFVDLPLIQNAQDVALTKETTQSAPLKYPI